jgi:hypothetical protein
VEEASSTNSGLDVLGATEPRLWTRPLRELTPETSYGFDVIWFAEHVLEKPLDLWEQWVVIHAGELLPDGRPRFRKVLVIVARQAGKTFLCMVLALYWLFAERQKLILGMSTNLDYAKEAWEEAVELAKATPDLARELPATKMQGVRNANGQQTFTTLAKCRYKIAASNRKGGRSLTVNRAIVDEIREHANWLAWNAAYNAMNAIPDAQLWAISNQGDEQAVVLDSLRAAGIAETDPELGLFEYSAPDGSDPTDIHAIAMANPNLGRRGRSAESFLADGRRAKAAGGEELTGFLTEVMCVRVRILDPVVDAGQWAQCLDPIDMAEYRSRTALCFDISPDGQHATLAAAAAMPDGRVVVDVVDAWSGWDATARLRAALPGHAARVKPRLLGWFPAGPAAEVAAAMADRRGWPPRRVVIEEIRIETTAVCMGLAEQIRSQQIAHPGNDLLDAHVLGAERLHQGDAWRFTRRGVGHVDGAYALAGAVHLARVMPPAPPPLAIA